MGSLSIALGGLQADESGLSVTSNNISNINTKGYTRQVVELSEQSPLESGGLSYGTGVSVDKITSVRDTILEQNIDAATQQQSQSQAYTNAMTQVQSMFNDSSGTGLQSALSGFYNSFTQLATNPTDSAERQAVISAAQTLASTFNQMAGNLNNIDANLDTQVGADVQQINSLASQIASLNGQLSQAGQQDNNTLLDQRDQLVQQLSGLTGVTITNNSDGTISVATANGSPLVSGAQASTLTTAVNPANGHVDVFAQGTDITSALSGGDLAGTIQARDQGVGATLSQLDTLAAGIASSANTAHEAGYDLNGNAGQALFTVPSSVPGTASAISVNITSPDEIAASGTAPTIGDDGTTITASGDNSNALAIAALQNQDNVGGEKAIDYYSNLVAQLGSSVSQATANSTAQQAAITQLQQQLSSVSGVSLDEESVNLIQYQRAYQASAQVISVVNTLMSDAINLGVSTSA
jgi:flagellar hook-associated protein 1 FlgK